MCRGGAAGAGFEPGWSGSGACQDGERNTFVTKRNLSSGLCSLLTAHTAFELPDLSEFAFAEDTLAGKNGWHPARLRS